MSQVSTKVFIVSVNIAFILGMITHKGCFSTSSEQEAPKVVEVKVDESKGALKPKIKKPVAPKPKKRVLVPKGFDYSKAVVGQIKELKDSNLPTSGIFIDMKTRKVLWAKNPRTAVPIASMTKMMTLLLALEDIMRPNNITSKTVVQVTREAFKVGGSQVYLDPKESFTLAELLKAVSIKSANDAAFLVAQFLGGGDVHSFVRRMNDRALQLGMKKTKFYNPHGLPGSTSRKDNVSCPEDLVLLAEQLLKYPPTTKLSSIWRDKFRNGTFDLQNTNKLVEGNKYGGAIGVDGMKTGYIKRSGFCNTITCKRGGRRIIAVATGFRTSAKRDNFMRKLLDWGYQK